MIVDTDAISWSLRRVLQVCDHLSDIDYVLQVDNRAPDIVRLTPSGMKTIPLPVALGYLRSKMPTLRYRKYSMESIREDSIVGYGYTANNRAEFRFLNALLDPTHSSGRVVNICDSPYATLSGIHGELGDLFMSSLKELLNDRASLPAGLVLQIRVLLVSLQSAASVMGSLKPHGFVVANDHSPAPVAWAGVARAFGKRVMYLQHAHVHKGFPALDFDLSILRDRASRRAYSAIGPSQGRVVVLPRGGVWGFRGPMEIAEKRQQVRHDSGAHVVFYPSSVFDEDYLFGAVEAQLSNPSTRRVSVKLHPNSKSSLLGTLPMGADLIESIPVDPHVAVCGNSSVVLDVLERGCLAYVDKRIDSLAPDYYGFVQAGLCDEVLSERAIGRWWKSQPRSACAQVGKLARYSGTVGGALNRLLYLWSRAKVRANLRAWGILR